jgi:hypothetical protein
LALHQQQLLYCGSNVNEAKPVSYGATIHAQFTGLCVSFAVDSDSDRNATQPAPDLEHERSRQVLDAQAQAWARTARKWIWIVGIAALTATAACVGFLLN